MAELKPEEDKNEIEYTVTELKKVQAMLMRS